MLYRYQNYVMMDSMYWGDSAHPTLVPNSFFARILGEGVLAEDVQGRAMKETHARSHMALIPKALLARKHAELLSHST